MGETQQPPTEATGSTQSLNADQQQRIVDAEKLFAGNQEVFIRNGTDVYRLRKTRLGKLILCK